MAYGSAEIPSDELGWLAQDKVLLIGNNYARTSALTVWNYTGSFADADESDAAFPINLIYDDQDDRQAREDTGNTESYILFQWSTGIEVDSIAILNHNLSSVVKTVAVEIADNAFFTSNLVQLATATPSTDKRQIFLDLYHTGATARRYTNVQYLRLKFTSGGSTTTNIGEVIVGRRRQMRLNPILPYDERNLVTTRLSAETLSGVQNHIILAKGQRFLNAVLPTGADARVTDLRAFFEGDTDYAARPFLWIDEPSTNPSDAYWFGFTSAAQAAIRRGFSRRDWPFIAKEKGPNFLASGGI